MKTKTIGLLIVSLMALSVVARADSRIEKTLALAPGGEFVLEADGGSVTVTGSSASGARIVVTSNRDDLQSLYTFNFESSNGLVRVTARKKSFQWFSNANLHFDVTVPSQTRLSVKTGGGSVKVSSLEGEQNLGTSGGSINALDVHGNVVARTSGGGITVNSLDGSLEARTIGGSIHIEGLTGRVSAHTSGGSIRATLARGNSQGGQLETSGGSIRVSLDPTANLNLDASTSGGSVSTDLPVRVQGTISHSSLHGSIGSGGPTLRLHTSGGSIHISAI
jgi:Toastrack DUF4097